MRQPFSKPPKTAVDRGRVALQVLIALTLLITVVGVTAGLSSGQKTWPRVVRVILSLSLSIAAYRGVRWAALGIGVLYLAASAQAAYTAYVLLELVPFTAWAEGACSLACPSASQQMCDFVSGCRWVECAGEPTRACSDFGYDECPRQACRRTAR